MAVKGVFASDANIIGTRRGDFASAVLSINPTGNAPFFALSAGMPDAGAVDPTVTWFEENHIPGRAQVQVLVNSSATTLSVDDASSYTAGVVLLVEQTGEYLYVSAVSSNTLTIQRGFAGSTAATISNLTHYVQRITTAFEEGSSRPTAMANLGYPRYNFMQIMRNSWNVTGTARATQYITGDITAKNRADCAMQHSEDLERSMLWGRKSIGILNSAPFRTMDGVLTQITTNVTVASSTTSYDNLVTFLQSVFAKNIKGKPNERITFTGNNVLSIVSKIARITNSNIYLEPGATEFGMKVTKLITPFGDISLVTHPLMNENPTWTNDLYVLHPGAVRVRYLRRTEIDSYDRNGTRAGVDGDYGVMTTEASVEYQAEKTGGKFTGMVAAA